MSTTSPSYFALLPGGGKEEEVPFLHSQPFLLISQTIARSGRREKEKEKEGKKRLE